MSVLSCDLNYPYSEWSDLLGSVCYITGCNGTLEGGLGQYLLTLTGSVYGVELSAIFLRQPITEQIKLLLDTLRRAEREASLVVANSYGAFLTLLAMSDTSPLDTKIILLSPVLGRTITPTGIFKPPLANRLTERLKQGRIRARRLEIHVGERDELFSVDLVKLVSRYAKADTLRIYEGAGHNLSIDVVRAAVGRHVSDEGR